jgi:hypothetical protein
VLENFISMVVGVEEHHFVTRFPGFAGLSFRLQQHANQGVRMVTKSGVKQGPQNIDYQVSVRVGNI